MITKRIGNDIRIEWAVVMKSGQKADFSSVNTMSVSLRHSRSGQLYPQNSVAVDNIIKLDFIASEQLRTGQYDLLLEYTRVDSGLEDGIATTTVDYCRVFRLISIQCEDPDDDRTINVVSVLEKGDKGDPFTFDDFTPEQIEDLMRPATDAGAYATEQGNYAKAQGIFANEKANLADQKATLAQQKADLVDSKVAGYDDKVGEVDSLILTVEQDEQTRQAQEATRQTNETDRIAAESNRQTQESGRQSNETGRQSAETERVSAENARVSAEQGRVSTESTRQTQETTRQSQESGRVSAENTRASNESGRQSAETARQTAEGVRNSNETTRQAQEQARQTNTATAIQNVEDWLDAADAILAGKQDKLDIDKANGDNNKFLNELGDFEHIDHAQLENLNADDDFQHITKGEKNDISNTKGLLNNVLDYLNTVSVLAYGIEWSDDVSSTQSARIGNPELHRVLPVQSGMRGCLLNDDGTVNYYLDANDWTKKEDGSASVLNGDDGMVMVEIPRHFERYESDNGTHRKLITVFPLPGFNEVPTAYMSAYKATVERSVNKLASVKSMDAKYRGGNNQSAWDGTYRSVLGTNATSISLTNFRAYARNRGNGTIWNCNTYIAYKTVVWLYYIEYANFNVQAEFNSDFTENGYRQGGLGAGITTLSSTAWSNYNSQYPFVPCGYTDELGNNTGIKEFTMPAEYESEAGRVSYVPRYRGIELLFGQDWNWMDGLKIEIQSEEAGGESRLYVADDVSKYNSSGYELYSYKGLIPRANGYVKTIIGDDIVPATTGGGTTTYFADYFYTSIPATGSSERAVRFGGNANRGAYAGLACSHSDDAASNSYAHFGSRLTCHPIRNSDH